MADFNSLPGHVWPATARREADGVVSIGGVRLTDLAEEYGTPVFVLDEADFRSRCRAMADAFHGPQNVHYASKAFLSGTIARWVHEEGLHLDVASGMEMAVALHAGFPAKDMTFHGNNKSVAELRDAVAAGVGHIVVDSLSELRRLSAVAAEAGTVQDVFIRVKPGVEAHTHEFIATAHEDQKFGLSLATGAAAEAARRVLDKPRTMRLLGLHSHIGSQIFDTGGFEIAARRLIGLHTDIAREHGVDLTHIGLGGGFGIAYTSEHTPLSPAQLGAQLADLVEREFTAAGADAGSAVPKVSVEPGRAIVGPSTFTLYEVGTVKPVVVNERVTRAYISVDGGMSDNIRPALYQADYSCTLAGRRSDAEPMLSRVVGKHCESGDIIVLDEYLPADLRSGDLIAVPGTGAYCRSLSSQYNHTPRPPVVAVRDGQARLIVRRETIEDLLALDVG